MLRRIWIAWFTANLLIVAAVSGLAGGWYLRWPLFTGLVAELGLIMLPNLLLPLLLLKVWWPEPVDSIRGALGWTWNG